MAEVICRDRGACAGGSREGGSGRPEAGAGPVPPGRPRPREAPSEGRRGRSGGSPGPRGEKPSRAGSGEGSRFNRRSRVSFTRRFRCPDPSEAQVLQGLQEEGFFGVVEEVQPRRGAVAAGEALHRRGAHQDGTASSPPLGQGPVQQAQEGQPPGGPLICPAGPGVRHGLPFLGLRRPYLGSPDFLAAFSAYMRWSAWSMSSSRVSPWPGQRTAWPVLRDMR